MTIKEIAEKAGVSRGTVDRVLHNRGHVNEDVKRLVLHIAQKNGYKPNRAAQALAMSKESKTIGVILISETNPFFHPLLKGMYAAQREFDLYSISLKIKYMRYHNTEEQITLMNEFKDEGIDALIMSPITSLPIKKHINRFIDYKIPVITLTSDLAESNRVAHVGCDYIMSGKTAGNLMYYFAPNARKICVIIGSMSSKSHADRLTGFKAICEEVYPEYPEIHVVECEDSDDISEKLLSETIMEDPDLNIFYFAAGGISGGLKAISQHIGDNKPMIITVDETPSVIEGIRSGLVQATISQEPYRQGYEAFRLAANAVIERSVAKRKDVKVNNDIVMKYNVDRNPNY